jgi:hypothetical protein
MKQGGDAKVANSSPTFVPSWVVLRVICGNPPWRDDWLMRLSTHRHPTKYRQTKRIGL